mmetsp:Transcript_31269/g.61234  ORF Transcript_31269/g.61234 Transcript_31269/m.61234 type:complete len:83 (-) Transcript_31269:231-479(-)
MPSDKLRFDRFKRCFGTRRHHEDRCHCSPKRLYFVWIGGKRLMQYRNHAWSSKMTSWPLCPSYALSHPDIRKATKIPVRELV